MSRPLSMRRSTMLMGSMLMLGVVALPLASPAHASPTADCAVPASTGAYPPSTASIALRTSVLTAGSTNVVTASGFAKAGQTSHGARVTLTMCSTPTVVGTAAIAADGTISRTITVPLGTALGHHVLQAVGPNGIGGATTVSTTFTVVAGAASSSASGSGSGSLPFTGAEIAGTTAVGVALLAGGTTLAVVFRRRRRDRSA